MSVRKATHAGTWYSDDKKVLTKLFQSILENAEEHLTKENKIQRHLKIAIAPHAGYKYSAKIAALSFALLKHPNDPNGTNDTNDTKEKGIKLNPKSKPKLNLKSKAKTKVVLLGPSHVMPGSKCYATKRDFFETPFGNIPIDKNYIKELKLENKSVEDFPEEFDDAEHCLEMLCPFIQFQLKTNFELIPLVIGRMNEKSIKSLAESLSPLCGSPNAILLVSSDFCHWGPDYNFVQCPESFKGPLSGPEPINEYIHRLDHLAFSAISDAKGYELFKDYKKKFENTICGEYPITLMLEIIKNIVNGGNGKTELKCHLCGYSQSEPNLGERKPFYGKNSVSYASLLWFEQEK